jgi:GT2 family glycosyltransferase
MTPVANRADNNAQVHVVIPVFNGWEQTEVCLQALKKSPLYHRLCIVIVDHGSTDATKTALPAGYPEITHLLGDPTLWWTGAVNLGIRSAIADGAEQIMLLNNDCYIAPDMVERLLAHASHNPTAIIAPVQKDYATGKVVFDVATTCFALGFTTLIPPRALAKPANDTLCSTKLIIGGRGVLIPRDILRRVGPFDEINLPHYGADHDFYLRCRKQGISLFTALDAVVYVDSDKTTLATRLGALSMTEFIVTLRSRRSHRNVHDLVTLFRKHYPLRGFHYVGVALNLVRYAIRYLFERAKHIIFLPSRNSNARAEK